MAVEVLSLSSFSLYLSGWCFNLYSTDFFLTIVVNLYNIGFIFTSFQSVQYWFFFSYITIIVNLYSIGFCVYWFFNLYSTSFFSPLYNHCY
jgi:hypothetical protein